MQRTLTMWLLTFCLLGLNGCLLSHSRHTVIRQGEPLQPTTFESEQARSTFESFVETMIDNDDNQSHSSVAIPFLVGVEQSKKTSATAIRNDVMTMFDVNGDGFISDYEAGLHQEY